mgnify:CR=1 FL=1
MLESILTSTMTLSSFLMCAAASLLLGIAAALLLTRGTRTTQSFAVTIAVLPLAVQVVIMLVNGNLGVGVAVAGAFGLVRFRSAPGNAREITAIFFAMTLGLATGMGYLGLAALFFVIFAAALLLLSVLKLGQGFAAERILKITIPENMDYDGLFTDVFEQYLRTYELEQVKTTNMGTLYELQYRVVLRQPQVSKAFLDALRCRNGNLTISCARVCSKEAL